MSKEDLAKGLKAIEDDDVRSKVAAGDIGAAGELDLTEEETTLLRSAAEDPYYPEVAGFAFDAFLKIDQTSGELSKSGGTASSPAESISFNFTPWHEPKWEQ